jgi:Delta7-sterol 5-desaturase
MIWDEFFFKWTKIAGNVTFRYFLIAGTAFFLFYFILNGILANRKMQAKFPKLNDYTRDISYSLITILIFATMAAVVFVLLDGYTLFYREVDTYGWVYFFLTFPAMFLIHDAYFYWAHRLMHHPRLFKAIHKIHHHSTNPSPWTAYSFHPFEAVIEAGIILVIGLILPVHVAAFGLFMLFQFSYNVYGHLGYELYPRNFHRTWVGRWINTGTAHNLHHQYFHGNYGLYTLIWDRLFGTLRPDYEEKFDQVTTPSPSSPDKKLEKNLA